MKTLSRIAIGALLSLSTVAHAEGPKTLEYSRNGEVSPGTDAPSIDAMVSVIDNGSTERLKATLEYGERVLCEACVPLLSEKLLESNDARVREMAAWWLRRQPFAAPMVLAKLRTTVRRSQSEELRARAAEALGEMMDPHALPDLVDAALEDKAASVRASAVRALARLNSEDAAATFADVLSDRSSEVRLAALDVLIRVGSFREYDTLLPLLGDSDANVRARAARLLGEHRVREAVTALSAMLRGDDSAAARRAAAWSLGRIGGEAAHKALLAASKKELNEQVSSAIEIAQRMR